MAISSIKASGADYTTPTSWWADLPATLLENEYGEFYDEEYTKAGNTTFSGYSLINL